MRDIRPIRSEADLAWALGEVQAYFEDQPALGSEEGNRFEVLSDLVETYERAHHPVRAADPVDVIRYAIESMGRTQAELGRLIGRTRASEILNRRRYLTLEQIRTISEAWHLPVGALTKRYDLTLERA